MQMHALSCYLENHHVTIITHDVHCSDRTKFFEYVTLKPTYSF